MIPINISRFCIENDFMFIEGFSDLTFFSVRVANTINIIRGFFVILFFSFDVIDVVYMNNVIIPDEKVMITTNGSQLDAHSL